MVNPVHQEADERYRNGFVDPSVHTVFNVHKLIAGVIQILQYEVVENSLL